MAQLSLNMRRALSYAAENYVQHAGVRDIFDAVTGLSQPPNCAFVFGERRSGKSHLSIALTSRLVASGTCPRLIDGTEFDSWEDVCSVCANREVPILIDDCHVLLQRTLPGMSGAFVDFWESLRRSGGSLVIFSAQLPEAFPCDQHVMSRLKAAVLFKIGHPDSEDVAKVIKACAGQRGLKLSERKVQFLVPRLKPTLDAIEAYMDRVLLIAETLSRPLGFPALEDALENGNSHVPEGAVARE